MSERFNVFFSKKALKFVAGLDQGYQRNVELLKKVFQLEPVPADLYHVKKLDPHGFSYRIRIGKIRLVYEVDWQKHSIWVYQAGFRESVYD